MEVLSFFVILFCVPISESIKYDHGDHSHPTVSRDKPSNFLRDQDILWDKEHIKEDIDDQGFYDFDDNASNQELEFQYFMLHDLDGNGMLDGLELLAALNHITHTPPALVEFPDHTSTLLEIQRKNNEKYDSDATIIDIIFEQDDINNDGFLSYIEFSISRK